MTPRLLTLPQACMYLGLGRTSLQRLVASGAIARVAVVLDPLKRPTFRYDTEDLDRYIEKSRTKRLSPRPCAGGFGN